MLHNSWIIINRDTNEAIMEIWNENILKFLKPEFEAIPTHLYLFNLNKRIKKHLTNN